MPESPGAPSISERIGVRINIGIWIGNGKRKRIIRINIRGWIRRRMAIRIIIRSGPMGMSVAMAAIAATIIADRSYGI